MSITPDQLHQGDPERDSRIHHPLSSRFQAGYCRYLATECGRQHWPRDDWGFEQNYNLERMTGIMLEEIRNKLK